jgi:hypothetical protein
MAEEPPFYVGYLPLPRRLRGFLVALVAVLLLADVAVALAAFRDQPAHAGGAWGEAGEVAFQGRFQARPYPLLRRADRTVLLVGEDKHGAPAGLDALDGALVEARGYPILRGDLTVLQLDQVPTRQPGEPPVLPPLAEARTTRLAGELVDSKCYAGAMNPGEGKTHKGCGALCVFGGIPPLMVVRGAGPNPLWYILADDRGGPLGDRVAPFVGDPIELGGRIVEAPGYRLFEIAPETLDALQ